MLILWKDQILLFGLYLKIIDYIGKVTSAVYSPRLKENIALGMVSIENSEIDNLFDIEMRESTNKAKVVLKPFYDPKKNITSKSL